MKSRDFCYWLQGFFELNEGKVELSATQVAHIRDHLNMVFIHEIDPSFPQHQQAALDAAHSRTPPRQFQPSRGDIKIKC